MNSDNLAVSDCAPFEPSSAWKVLIADDEQEMHTFTEVVLADYRFEGRSIEWIHAYSAAGAFELLRQTDDIAVLLLDVVMESPNAGLDLVRRIRDELQNHRIRILLRTGQPQIAPEHDVIQRYDINDYRSKGEDTVLRLPLAMTTALRSYRDLLRLAEQREALEVANTELQQFASMASHDLQAPLRRIGGLAHILNDSAKDKLDEREQRLLARIGHSVKNMQSLVRDLLDLGVAGRHDYKLEAVDCNEVMEEVRAVLKPLLEERDVQLQVGTLPTVSGRFGFLVQLLQNLIGNGIKYQPGDQPKVEVTCEQVGSEWVFAVSDHGLGIEPQFQQQIFQAFKRLHSSSQFEGNGIGLAICRKVIEFHRGRLWVESVAGEGSTFFFSIPVSRDDD